jgi:hypothetical protein
VLKLATGAGKTTVMAMIILDARSHAHVHCDPTQAPVASVTGFLKEKSAMAVARWCGKERNFTGKHMGARVCRVHHGLGTGSGPPITSAAKTARMELAENSKLATSAHREGLKE